MWPGSSQKQKERKKATGVTKKAHLIGPHSKENKNEETSQKQSDMRRKWKRKRKTCIEEGFCKREAHKVKEDKAINMGNL